MDNYDVFISYSRKDADVVRLIEKELTEYGITYFVDRSDIDLGEDFAEKIARCIYDCEIVLFVWSENSNQSENTANEIALAIDFQKTIVPFKIGRFKPDFKLAYRLVRFNRIETADFNARQIHEMAEKLAVQLGKDKKTEPISNDPSAEQPPRPTKPAAEAQSVLKIHTDTECRVFVDFQERGTARPGSILRIPLSSGTYCLRFESISDKDRYMEDLNYGISGGTERVYNVNLHGHDQNTAPDSKSSLFNMSDPSVHITYSAPMTEEELYEEGDKQYKAGDYSDAVRWYRRSASKGFTPAMCALARCYEEGCGTAADPVKAAEWYTKAAEDGDAEAMKNLARCYTDGIGVKADTRISKLIGRAYEAKLKGSNLQALSLLSDALLS